MADFPYPDEPTTVKTFQNRVEACYVEAGRIFPDPHDPDAYRHFTRYGYSCRHMPEPVASAKHLQELRDELGLSQPPPPIDPGTPVARPLVGPLRVQDKMFRDDSGYRRVFFCSWFPALRILRDNPAEFERQLNAIAAAGYQGVRVFLAVGGWTPAWDGREVVPVGFTKWQWTGNFLRTDQYGPFVDGWSDYDDLLRRLLRACVARRLRLHITTGDMQIICADLGLEEQLHARLARICAEEGGTNVIALAEMTNEFPINRYGGESTLSISQMGRLIRVWQAAMPGLLCAQGAIPQDEEPNALRRMSTHGDVCAVHVTRKPFETCLKHTHALVHWEGDYRGFDKPFWEGEPAGPGQDSYQQLDDPASNVALYAMHALTGQASVRFQGAAVLSKRPLESDWGFAELPALFAQWLPEDVATWPHASNNTEKGITYWFKDREFRTASFESWNTAPPRPVESWTLHTGNAQQQGTGTPPRATGFFTGRFA